MAHPNCYHCGQPATDNNRIIFDSKAFCCTGCKTVYEIFTANGLTDYYDLGQFPGATPVSAGKYDFLDNVEIADKLLEFREGTTNIVTLHVPHIHCSSCIWILENLHRLDKGIVSSRANFQRKTVRITFNEETNLHQVVDLLCRIGYEPNITLSDYETTKKHADRSLMIKLAVAFFCFGNIMLLSFPEYFEVSEFWLDQYKGFFRTLIFALALPTFLYSASGYYTAAWKSLRNGFLSIEVPIALGIVIFFIRSTTDMFFNHGPGFFDSMAGLIFFMLLGKMFQAKTYDFLNFERDYKSYFPVAVTCLSPDGTETNLPIHEVKQGQRLLVRNQELIPCDGVLISGDANIDYSFVTGEAIPVAKSNGETLFAGGRQTGSSIEIEALRSVSQSYLTQLWEHEAFKKEEHLKLKSITDKVSRYFTPVLLLLAFSGLTYWLFFDMKTAFDVFTAVLIVACPCALALTAPFTLGNIIRIMGRHSMYLKNTSVIEKMALADTIVFDKTGTITSARVSDISYQGKPLTKEEQGLLRLAVRASNHPLSRMLYDLLPASGQTDIEQFSEISGQGVEAVVSGKTIRVGKASFTDENQQATPNQTAVHVSIDGQYIGKFIFANQYRPGLQSLFEGLDKRYKLVLLSGDNAGEESKLRELLPPDTELIFNQKPDEKLAYIKSLQQEGRKVIMLGDGLNDAGALAQSDVGISVSEDVNIFSPACDAILDAAIFNKFGRFLTLARKSVLIMQLSFGLSLLYNVVGLYFALSGTMSPLFAAIIMPLSTVTIVSFVTIMGNFWARKTGVSVPVEKPEKTDGLTNVIFSAGTPKYI